MWGPTTITTSCHQGGSTTSLTPAMALSVLPSSSSSSSSLPSLSPSHAIPCCLSASAPFVSSSIFQISRGGADDGDNNNEEEEEEEEEEDDSDNVKNPMMQEILETNDDDYYGVLGLSTTSRVSQREIQKAYRKRAVRIHPDKTGGDRRAFDKVAKAFEVLSDEETRAIYDRFGVNGLQNNNNGEGMGPGRRGSSSFSDLFQSMFQHQQQNAAMRNRTVRYQLQVSLEDLYRGITQDIWISAPNTYGGGGSSNRSGKKVQVSIPRGAVAGQAIVLNGAIDFATSKDAPPGDLIFVIMPAPHPVFTRKNHDLAMELNISFEEAICGFDQRTITHLDGTTLELQSARMSQSPSFKEGDTSSSSLPPTVIATGDVQVLKGRGFPKSPHGDEYGDLYIQFKVDMPKSTTNNKHPLTVEEREELRRLLEKLQGKRMSVRNSNTSNKSKKPSLSSSSSNKKKRKDKDKTKTKTTTTKVKPSSNIHRLIPGKVSDFGRATGTSQQQWQQSSFVDDNDDDFASSFFGAHHPLFGGGSSSTFFQSSSSSSRNRDGSTSRTRKFYFGSHPFDGEDGEPGGEQQQCQQM